VEARKPIDRGVRRLVKGLTLATEGSGPLLQRDYWAVIRQCTLSPAELMARVARDFCVFAPPDLVRFERVDSAAGPLEPGEELEVAIRMAGRFRVRVLHRDRNSLTLGTMRGHPEAGRITFGAYRNGPGDVIFHIRSRARSSSRSRLAGFVTAGEPMQTTTWTDFIDRLAHTVGYGVIGSLHAETVEIDDEAGDPETVCSPTFRAVGE
jgi:hypothetical protein